MSLGFTKMQALRNDFIIVRGPIQLTSDQIIKLCDRHTGIGSDGLIAVTPISQSLLKMEFWDPTGGSQDMCGNGLRCVTRFAVESKLVDVGVFTVRTGAGDLTVEWDGQSPNIKAQICKGKLNPQPIPLCGLDFYKVDVGIPHAVAFVEDYETAPVVTVGPQVQADKHFPRRPDVDFVEVVSQHKIKMKVWEVGVGQTLACGTGMTASAIAASKLHNVTFPVDVETLGGHGTITVDEAGYYYLTGPAETVYSGTISSL